jgi:dTMP kinase
MQNQHRPRGKFITFEGIDASGKSTQARLLFSRLQKDKIPVLLTREPGGFQVDISEEIRKIILNPSRFPMDEKTELLLFMASRSQHVSQCIVPALGEGTHVLCDRFADATLAYQGYGRMVDPDRIHWLNRYACGSVWPDYTFLLDITVEEFCSRKKKENTKYDRIESAGEEFEGKVRNGYLSLAQKEPERFIMLDGTRSPEELHREIYEKTIVLLSTTRTK